MDRLHAWSQKHFSGLEASTIPAKSAHLLVPFNCVCVGLVAPWSPLEMSLCTLCRAPPAQPAGMSVIPAGGSS